MMWVWSNRPALVSTREADFLPSAVLSSSKGWIIKGRLCKLLENMSLLYMHMEASKHVSFLTLSVKTQLKSFYCDLLFSTKNHPSYGKEHSVKL